LKDREPESKGARLEVRNKGGKGVKRGTTGTVDLSEG